MTAARPNTLPTFEPSLDLLQRAQWLTKQLALEIASSLTPGMTETDAFQHAESVLRRYPNWVIHWHKPIIRFGSNTGISIHKRPEIVNHLQDTDIVFIDIGPVFELDGQQIEGDFGQTMVLGDHTLYAFLAEQAKVLFDMGLHYWRQYQPTGKALYEYLDTAAKQKKLELILDPAGHLIGAFPHQGWKKGMNHYDGLLESGQWILEIQVKDPRHPYGAFFEDILI